MIVRAFGNFCSLLAVMWESLPLPPPMTAISSCKMVRPSASNNLQSKQTWCSLTFIETSDPVHWFQFSSLCSVFTDRQVLRFRFNNEEKFLLGLFLLVLAAPELATDGWLELITLNGENIIWPHWFSPEAVWLLTDTGRWNISRAGQRLGSTSSELPLLKTRHDLTLQQNLEVEHFQKEEPVMPKEMQSHCKDSGRLLEPMKFGQGRSQLPKSFLFLKEKSTGRWPHYLDSDKSKEKYLSHASLRHSEPCYYDIWKLVLSTYTIPEIEMFLVFQFLRKMVAKPI